MSIFEKVSVLDGLHIVPDFVKNSHRIPVRHLWFFGIACLLHSLWALATRKAYLQRSRRESYCRASSATAFSSHERADP